MTNYKVVGANRPDDDEVQLSLRLNLDGQPTVYARNPGGEWQAVLFFDRQGNVQAVDAARVRGIEAGRDGHVIIIYTTYRKGFAVAGDEGEA